MIGVYYHGDPILIYDKIIRECMEQRGYIYSDKDSLVGRDDDFSAVLLCYSMPVIDNDMRKKFETEMVKKVSGVLGVIKCRIDNLRFGGHRPRPPIYFRYWDDEPIDNPPPPDDGEKAPISGPFCYKTSMTAWAFAR